MYYKLRQGSVTNWGTFVLLQFRTNIVTNMDSFIITLLQVLLQIGAAITN